MIHSSRSLVTLQPARQAALQAIMTVEDARQRGARLPSMPHVRTFLRLLTGSGRINNEVARRVPGGEARPWRAENSASEHRIHPQNAAGSAEG